MLNGDIPHDDLCRRGNIGCVDHIKMIEMITSDHDIRKAQLIQYSGDMVRRVVMKLLEKGADVELLLQHPSKALNEYQMRKLVLFEQRSNIDFKNSKKLTIRYYEEPASLRAVKLDDKFPAVGWYTYRIRRKDKDEEDTTPWFYGHNNPNIIVHHDGAEYNDFTDFFDEVFKALWKMADSPDKVWKAQAGNQVSEKNK